MFAISEWTLLKSHAWEARRAFVETVAKGESGARIAPFLIDSDVVMNLYAARSSASRSMSCNVRSPKPGDRWEAMYRGVNIVVMHVCPNAGINLAEAALQVAAEDDAIVSTLDCAAADSIFPAAHRQTREQHAQRCPSEDA